MDSKIQAYLKGTDPTGMYMRKVLNFYASGKMRSILLKQHITELEFFPLIKKQGSSFQVNFQYYNLCVIMEFGESEFEYAVYTRNCSADELEQSIVTKLYGTDFAVEVFFAAFFRLLKEDVRLIKTNQTIEKKKLYKIISSICYAIMFLVLAVPSVYVLITRDTIQLDPWFLAAVLVPLIVSEIFDFLAAKE